MTTWDWKCMRTLFGLITSRMTQEHPGLEPVVISGHEGCKVGSWLRVQLPKR